MTLAGTRRCHRPGTPRSTPSAGAAPQSLKLSLPSFWLGQERPTGKDYVERDVMDPPGERRGSDAEIRREIAGRAIEALIAGESPPAHWPDWRIVGKASPEELREAPRGRVTKPRPQGQSQSDQTPRGAVESGCGVKRFRCDDERALLGRAQGEDHPYAARHGRCRSQGRE
jgi:hypothetical protein